MAEDFTDRICPIVKDLRQSPIIAGQVQADLEAIFKPFHREDLYAALNALNREVHNENIFQDPYYFELVGKDSGINHFEIRIDPKFVFDQVSDAHFTHHSRRSPS